MSHPGVIWNRPPLCPRRERRQVAFLSFLFGVCVFFSWLLLTAPELSLQQPYTRLLLLRSHSSNSLGFFPPFCCFDLLIGSDRSTCLVFYQISTLVYEVIWYLVLERTTRYSYDSSYIVLDYVLYHVYVDCNIFCVGAVRFCSQVMIFRFFFCFVFFFFLIFAIFLPIQGMIGAYPVTTD